MTTDEVLDSLHPAFAAVMRKALPLMQNQMPSGSEVRLIDGFRTPADQEANVASGASAVPTSWHEYGLGVDFGVFENGAYVTRGDDQRYKDAGYIAKASLSGLTWGGDWRKPDWDHLEWHPGFTMAQYQAWLSSHPIPGMRT